MRIQIIFFSSILLVCSYSWSQTGYIGRKNALELRLAIGPSYSRTIEKKEDIIVSKPVFAHLQFGFSYVIAAFKKVDVSFGYQYGTYDVKINNFTDYDTVNLSWGKTYLQKVYDVVSEPKMTLQCFNFQYKYYRKQNLAPLGKYIGFGVMFGNAVIPKSSQIVLADYGIEISSGMFKKTYTSFYDRPYTLKGNYSMRYMAFYMHLGQSIPIRPRLVITAQLSIPAFFIFGTTQGWKFRIGDYDPNYGAEITEVSEKSLSNELYFGITRANALRADLGIRLHF